MLIDQQKSKQMAEILGLVAEHLDIPDDIFQLARKRYTELGVWLKADHLERYQSDAGIYPQGSIRLGTSVRPVRMEDDYDVDLVYRRDIQKESTTQENLQKDVGDQLRRYIQYLSRAGQAVPTLSQGRRCWTLEYKGQFHMDVLPALPDDEASQHNLRDIEDAIVITDKKLREWQHSNPKGYANWFDDQQRVILLERREMMAKAAEVDVETISPERVSTPLRRVVQILKRHRDIRYQGDSDDKPISIIITTLAAGAYHGEPNIFEALIAVVPRMREGIKVRNDEYWVPNPINPENENFADKWKKTEEPQRAKRFFEWLQQVESDFLTASRQAGMQKIAESLSPVLGGEVVQRAMERYGRGLDQQHQGGQLRMAAKTGMLGAVGATLRKNTWYGA